MRAASKDRQEAAKKRRQAITYNVRGSTKVFKSFIIAAERFVLRTKVLLNFMELKTELLYSYSVSSRISITYRFVSWVPQQQCYMNCRCSILATASGYVGFVQYSNISKRRNKTKIYKEVVQQRALFFIYFWKMSPVIILCTVCCTIYCTSSFEGHCSPFNLFIRHQLCKTKKI